MQALARSVYGEKTVRMKQFVLEHLMTETAKLDGARAYSPRGHDADLHIQLKNGKQVAVYIINRALRLPEIREKYEDNTVRRLHTLFIVDQRLLPQHNEKTEAAYWVSALHALANGRIYAYSCDKREVTISPLHIDWKWGDETRLFQYGPAINVASLRAEVHECSSKYIVGRFATATFGDEAFWQKRSPMDDMRGQKYSWRNFSFHTERKRRAPEPEPRWDWEDFERFYEEVHGEDATFEWDWSEPQRGAGTGAQGRYSVRHADHYALLGVNVGANREEVKRAYRLKAREYHPDLHPQRKQEFTAKMAEINVAFETIMKSLVDD
jgi:hypothetical protein